MKVIHKEQDITDYVSAMSWGGSNSEVARKLELNIVNAPLDKTITPLNIGLADPIYLFDDDGVTELFRGFIVDREASSTSGTVTYTAYDILYYILKSKATYNFSSKTAEAITTMVCNDMEIPIGSLASTGLSQKLIVQGKTIYEIIMSAYTQAYQQNGKKYCITAKKGSLNVEEMGGVTCDIEFTEDTNILSSTYRENLNSMVNKVKIYDGEGNPIGAVQNDEDLKYGIFQEVYTKEEGKDANTTAKSMFSGVEKTFTLECINNNKAITGAGAIIRDSSTGLSGLVWIDSDVHTWSNGVATMSLTVTLKQMMATQTDINGSLINETESSSSSGGSSNKVTNTYGSKSNPPFSILNKYWYSIKNGFTTWYEAYSYYMANGGTKEEWKIVDKDNKEVQL